MYNTVEIERRVSWLRRRFLLVLGALIILFVLLLLLICFHISDTITTLCLICEVGLVLAVYAFVSKSKPAIIFGKEVVGRNIKEEEYIASLPVGSSLGYRQTGSRGVPQPFAPNTRANKRRTPPNVHGEVYIRLDDGSIELVRGLRREHLEMYEDGDILIKYAGTRYPVVISRKSTRQPCPMCGEINDMELELCHGCGLEIIREHEDCR